MQFSEVQEHQEYRVLIDTRQLLCELQIHDECPCYSPYEKYTEKVMESHSVLDTCINNGLHHRMVCWLILLPPGVGWYIMGHEPDTLPSYIKLRNCSYSIILKYIDYPSTTQVHLPNPGLTISSYGLSLASALTLHRVHKWVGMLPFKIRLPAAS